MFMIFMAQEKCDTFFLTFFLKNAYLFSVSIFVTFWKKSFLSLKTFSLWWYKAVIPNYSELRHFFGLDLGIW